MLLAVLGDIHGNLPAFEAALDDIDAAGIQMIVNTGDSVAGHPWPNEVLDILRVREIASAQGEMDRLTTSFLRKNRTLRERLSPEDFEAAGQAYDALQSEHLVYLRALPRQRVLRIEGVTIHLCHGSPSSSKEGIHEEASLARFRRWRETANAPLVLSGRTHRPLARMVDDTLFVNPGSVGEASDTPGLALYAIVNTEEEPWTVEHRTVAYEAGVREAGDGG